MQDSHSAVKANPRASVTSPKRKSDDIPGGRDVSPQGSRTVNQESAMDKVGVQDLSPSPKSAKTAAGGSPPRGNQLLRSEDSTEGGGQVVQATQPLFTGSATRPLGIVIETQPSRETRMEEMRRIPNWSGTDTKLRICHWGRHPAGKGLCVACN